MQPNLILIGMPGAGKSTVGKLFAERHDMRFVDTDTLIECAEGTSLQYIVDHHGYAALRALESDHLLRLGGQNCVISTGGSAVYSAYAMQHLSTLGPVVYLAASLKELEARIGNQDTRGLAKPAEQSFAELYCERAPLYEHYANHQIDSKGLTPSEVCDLLAAFAIQHPAAPNPSTK